MKVTCDARGSKDGVPQVGAPPPQPPVGKEAPGRSGRCGSGVRSDGRRGAGRRPSVLVGRGNEPPSSLCKQPRHDLGTCEMWHSNTKDVSYD